MRVVRCPTNEQLEELARRFPRFSSTDGFTALSATEFGFDFDGRNYVTLRRLIDAVNELAA